MDDFAAMECAKRQASEKKGMRKIIFELCAMGTSWLSEEGLPSSAEDVLNKNAGGAKRPSPLLSEPLGGAACFAAVSRGCQDAQCIKP